MNRKLLITLGVAVVVVVAAVVALSRRPSLLVDLGIKAAPSATPAMSPDAKNGTYLVADETVPLTNGEVTVQAEGVTLIRYKLFQQADGLLNEDLTTDAGVLLVGDTGGSGTFYYAAAFVSTASGWQGTNGILLGDRIAPQTIDVADDMFIVNYAVRKQGEPFSTAPSVGVTKYFQVRNGAFVEVQPRTP